MNKYGAIILAAGDGKRMQSAQPKVLMKVLFTPMLGWVVDSVEKAGIEKIGVVIGNGAGLVEAFLKKRGSYTTFTQSVRLGTGHAVLQAKKIYSQCENVLVLCGDAPLMDNETIEKSLARHLENNNDITIISAENKNPHGYGRIVRDEFGNVVEIVEQKDCTPKQAEICEINSGAYWFKGSTLEYALPLLTSQNAAGELYLTDTVGIVRKNGGNIGAFKTENWMIVLGANDRSDLANLNYMARMTIIGKHIANGIDIPCSDGVIIGKDVEIGADTTILPGTILRGKTVIGACSEIGPNTLLEDVTTGDGVILNSIQAYQSKLGNNIKVGPFSQLRAGTVLDDGIKIGDFVEIKNSKIGKNTSCAHLTYIGDSDVGKGVNFGCGCVTANYDGIEKFRTKIGDNAFIGCNTNLIAPVEVGENATTAAGSTITKNVPADSLVIERANVKMIEHWEKNSKRIKKG